MKRIGIIFAMKEELDEFFKKVKLKKEKKVFDLVFYECNYGKKEIVFVESGVGKVNSARATQMMIDEMNVECIFNIGVAGSVVKDVHIGDIVLGEKMVQHDFDITGFGYEKGFIPNVGPYVIGDPELLKIAKKTKSGEKVHVGVIASGDIFCTESKMSNKIAMKFDALCVEMEGASIAQVCYLCHMPFLVIRSISDSPDGSDNKQTYEEFLEESSRKVSDYLLKILDQV